MAAQPLIALDARCTHRCSVGMIRYARELAERLPRVAPDLHFATFTRGGNFGLDEQLRLPVSLMRARPRVVHHLSLYAPVWSVVPVIVTIHDLIHLRFPASFKSSVGPYYRLIVRALCARAVRVITDDEKTVDDLERYLGVPPEKVRVVALGVGERFLDEQFESAPQRRPQERPYLFYAGNHRPHKDLATLLHAWQALPATVPHDLVVTGDDDFGPDAARTRENGARLIAVGDVGDAKLATLMHEATALLYPSLCEGFGLPMLEALAVGTPVIASDTALPRVLRDCATVFPAGDAAALTSAITTVDAESMTARTARRRHAAAHTWDRCAHKTAEVYRELIERS